MELVRLLNAKHYDPQRGKFTSLAFRNSTGGGVSVIDAQCVGETGVSICDHVAAYYPERITGTPPVLWAFCTDILPPEHHLEQQTSELGDVCHHNIQAVSDRQLRRLINDRRLADFRTCAADGLRGTIEADVLGLGPAADAR